MDCDYVLDVVAGCKVAGYSVGLYNSCVGVLYTYVDGVEPSVL